MLSICLTTPHSNEERKKVLKMKRKIENFTKMKKWSELTTGSDRQRGTVRKICHSTAQSSAIKCSTVKYGTEQ